MPRGTLQPAAVAHCVPVTTKQTKWWRLHSHHQQPVAPVPLSTNKQSGGAFTLIIMLLAHEQMLHREDDELSETFSDDGSFTTVANCDPTAMAVSTRVGESLRPILQARLSDVLPLQAEDVSISPDDSISRVGGTASRVGSTAAPALAAGRVSLASLGAHDVARLLHAIDLGRYASSFLALPWRGADLDQAQDCDLEMCIAAPVHRRALLKQIASWRVDGVPSECFRSADSALDAQLDRVPELGSSYGSSFLSGGGSTVSSGQGSGLGSGMSTSSPQAVSQLVLERVELISGTSPEGSAEASELVDCGHQANAKGDFLEARRCFRAAFELTRKVSYAISAANMAFRLGDARAALREYEALLLRPNLSEAHRKGVHRKISEAIAMASALEALAAAMGVASAEEVPLLVAIEQAATSVADASTDSVDAQLDVALLASALEAARAAGVPAHLVACAHSTLEIAKRHAAERGRKEAESRVRQEAEDRVRRCAEDNLTAALPGWFHKASSARLSVAIENARAARVDATTLEAAEATLSNVVQEEADSERRLAAEQLAAAMPGFLKPLAGSPAAVEALRKATARARLVGVDEEVITRAEAEEQRMIAEMEARARVEAELVSRKMIRQRQRAAAMLVQSHARRNVAKRAMTAVAEARKAKALVDAKKLSEAKAEAVRKALMREAEEAEERRKQLALKRAETEGAKPEAAKPEAAKPEAAKPEAAKPEAAKPEAAAASSPTVARLASWRPPRSVPSSAVCVLAIACATLVVACGLHRALSPRAMQSRQQVVTGAMDRRQLWLATHAARSRDRQPSMQELESRCERGGDPTGCLRVWWRKAIQGAPPSWTRVAEDLKERRRRAMASITAEFERAPEWTKLSRLSLRQGARCTTRGGFSGCHRL